MTNLMQKLFTLLSIHSTPVKTWSRVNKHSYRLACKTFYPVSPQPQNMVICCKYLVSTSATRILWSESILAPGSVFISLIQEQSKSFSLAKNQHETQNKQTLWPLGRDLDRSWCHRHTSVKHSRLQPMDPWTEQQHSHMMLSIAMSSWAAIKKALD